MGMKGRRCARREWVSRQRVPMRWCCSGKPAKSLHPTSPLRPVATRRAHCRKRDTTPGRSARSTSAVSIGPPFSFRASRSPSPSCLLRSRVRARNFSFCELPQSSGHRLWHAPTICVSTVCAGSLRSPAAQAQVPCRSVLRDRPHFAAVSSRPAQGSPAPFARPASPLRPLPRRSPFSPAAKARLPSPLPSRPRARRSPQCLSCQWHSAPSSSRFHNDEAGAGKFQSASEILQIRRRSPAR